MDLSFNVRLPLDRHCLSEVHAVDRLTKEKERIAFVHLS